MDEFDLPDAYDSFDEYNDFDAIACANGDYNTFEENCIFRDHEGSDCDEDYEPEDYDGECDFYPEDYDL